ncbi:peptidyl-prolyl cis-trans isomerase [bacterium]|nr:peptidyl-prolyl cis-trans isomerase [bacterium]
MADNQKLNQAGDGGGAEARPHSIWREPIVHFILVGGLLFLLSNLRQQPADESEFEITVDRPRIAVMYHGFVRDFDREPTQAELQELIDDYIRTEVCVREARGMGLDRDDQLIRDHLRSKYELLLDDGSEPPTPTEEELQQFLEEHPERYRTEDSLSLMQIYLDPLQRAEPLLDAELLKQQLTGTEELGLVQELSDAGSLPPRLPLVALSEIGWQFDPLFADAIRDFPVGAWSGPVESSYGVHLVFIEERRAGRPLELGEIREDVERDWIEAQQREKLDAALEGVKQLYEISVDSFDMAQLASEDVPDEGAAE